MQRDKPRSLVFPMEGEQVDAAPGVTADETLEQDAKPVKARKTKADIVEEPVEPGVAPDPEKHPEAYAAYVADLRQKRKPYGAQMLKLAYPPRSGYKRHWFNDVGGRVQDYQDAGWTIVKDDKGKPVQRTVGAARDNSPLKAHLMEIPSVFWEEVEAERHAIAKAKMDDIKKSPAMAKPGEAKASDQGKFYSPREEAVSMTESLSRR